MVRWSWRLCLSASSIIQIRAAAFRRSTLQHVRPSSVWSERFLPTWSAHIVAVLCNSPSLSVFCFFTEGTRSFASMNKCYSPRLFADLSTFIKSAFLTALMNATNAAIVILPLAGGPIALSWPHCRPASQLMVAKVPDAKWQALPIPHP